MSDEILHECSRCRKVVKTVGALQPDPMRCVSCLLDEIRDLRALSASPVSIGMSPERFAEEVAKKLARITSRPFHPEGWDA